MSTRPPPARSPRPHALLARCAACALVATLASPPAEARSAAIAPASLAPADCASALFLGGARGADGIRALLGAASASAPALQPAIAGQDLARAVGVDLLSAGAAAAAGLAPEGSRALVASSNALGLSAPVADPALARAALDAWLAQLGPTRKTRAAPLQGPLASGGGGQERAGMVVKAAGGARLFTASGRGAVTLVIRLAHLGRRPGDVVPLVADPQVADALERQAGPAVLWVRGAGVARGAALRLDASAAGLVARGPLLPASPTPPGAQPLSALLDGESPPEAACAGALLCVRAAPGPALRELAARWSHGLAGRAFAADAQRAAWDGALQALLASASGGALARVDALDARALGEGEPGLSAIDLLAASGASKTPALAVAPAGDPDAGRGVALPGPPAACAGAEGGLEWLAWPCRKPAAFSPAGGPRELHARLDAAALARALAPLTPLDALRGPTAAALFAFKLLWGGLLAASGPLDASLRPMAATAPASPRGSPPAAGAPLELELRWPLSGRPLAQ